MVSPGALSVKHRNHRTSFQNLEIYGTRYDGIITEIGFEAGNHRCIRYILPRNATCVARHETTQSTVGDGKVHSNFPHLGKKNSVQCILFGWNVNIERTQ